MLQVKNILPLVAAALAIIAAFAAFQMAQSDDCCIPTASIWNSTQQL